MFRDWTYEKTISTPTEIKVKYSDAGGNPAEVQLKSTTWSETTSEYTTIRYYDRQEQLQSTDVVLTRVSFTRGTAAAVNGVYVAWRLSNQLGLPTGDANREGRTTYAYYVTSDGPLLTEEVTEEYISGYEFAGSLNIKDYTGITLSPDYVLASKTITRYEQFILPSGRSWNKTSTTRYIAAGLTQEGQQSASEQIALDEGDGVITLAVLQAMTVLTCDGTEVRTAIGRVPTPSRPAGQEVLAADIEDLKEKTSADYSSDTLGAGSWTLNEPAVAASDKGRVGLTFDYGTPGVDAVADYSIDTYRQPYSPDSYYDANGNLIDGKAPQAAQQYGETLNALKAGYAYGFNITTACQHLPSQPFAPLMVNAAGLSVATRINGTSWAFDNSGIVASSDLILCGVAGALKPLSSSWVRLPVDPANLPLLEPGGQP